MRCAGACAAGAAGAGFGDVVGELVSRRPWAIVIGCVSVLLLAPVAFFVGTASGVFVVEVDMLATDFRIDDDDIGERPYRLARARRATQPAPPALPLDSPAEASTARYTKSPPLMLFFRAPAESADLISADGEASRDAAAMQLDCGRDAPVMRQRSPPQPAPPPGAACDGACPARHRLGRRRRASSRGRRSGDARGHRAGADRHHRPLRRCRGRRCPSSRCPGVPVVDIPLHVPRGSSAHPHQRKLPPRTWSPRRVHHHAAAAGITRRRDLGPDVHEIGGEMVDVGRAAGHACARHSPRLAAPARAALSSDAVGSRARPEQQLLLRHVTDAHTVIVRGFTLRTAPMLRRQRGGPRQITRTIRRRGPRPRLRAAAAVRAFRRRRGS